MQELTKAWIALGVKQYELLPAHMLKEFCRVSSSEWYQKQDASWYPNAPFDTNIASPPPWCRIYHVQTMSYITLPSDPRFGVSLTLVRGARELDCRGTSKPVHYTVMEYDLKALQDLDRKRMADLTDQSLLQPTQLQIEADTVTRNFRCVK
jgi:hypothetical protein